MRVPGLAWLEFHVEPGPGRAGTTLRQRATFFPHGLAGQAYWYSIVPFHGLVFPAMLRKIGAAAERAPQTASPTPATPAF